jgi:hypothetical protein
MSARATLLVALFALAAGGCKCSEPAPAPAASGSGAAAGQAPGPPVPTRWPVPTGPVLAVLPGQGVGAMRIGATVDKIEREMELPCQDRTAEVCRYVTRAVEFMLKDGRVTGIRVHRAGRPAGPDLAGSPRTYGIFNGALLNEVRPGMLKDAVAKLLGPPTKVEPASGDGGFGTVEIHHYPGMKLELDAVQGGGVVLGGIVIEAQAD